MLATDLTRTFDPEPNVVEPLMDAGHRSLPHIGVLSTAADGTEGKPMHPDAPTNGTVRHHMVKTAEEAREKSLSWWVFVCAVGVVLVAFAFFATSDMISNIGEAQRLATNDANARNGLREALAEWNSNIDDRVESIGERVTRTSVVTEEGQVIDLVILGDGSVQRVETRQDGTSWAMP